MFKVLCLNHGVQLHQRMKCLVCREIKKSNSGTLKGKVISCVCACETTFNHV